MQLLQSGRTVTVANGIIAVPSPQVFFEYTGKTGMTVVGSWTGRSYRFSKPGARVPINASDVGSLAGIPNLRRA